MVLTRDDVVAWYELQRQEESGKTWDEHAQLDGTVSGATLSNDAPSSKFIGSHSFDGTNDYIQTYSGSLGQTYSVSFWYRTHSSFPGGDVICGQLTSGAGFADIAYSFWQNSSGTVSLFVSTGSSYLYNLESSISLSTSTWHHITITVDTSTGAKIYIDNVERASSAATGTANTETVPVTFMRYGDFNGRHTSGNITQGIIFNKALTATEVSTLYNSGDGITYRELFPLSDDLEAYYKLDGDATDETGTYNGTITGATSTTDSKIGTAYSFDGTNDLINTNIQIQNLESAGGTFSYGGWFKKDGTAIRCPIGESGSTYYMNWYIRLTDNLWGTGFYNGTTNVNYQDNPSNLSDMTSEYIHLFVTYDGTTLKKYLNGVEVGSHTATIDLSGITDTVVLGRRQTSSSLWWDGDMDEVKFIQRDLSPGEVRRLYSFGAALRYEDLDNTSPLIDGIKAYYKLDEDNASQTDSTDKGVTGTITGASFLSSAKINGGYDMSGDQEYMELDTWPNIGIDNAMSVSLWVLCDNTTQGRVVSDNNATIKVSVSQTGAIAARLGYTDEATATFSSKTGWYHVAATFSDIAASASNEIKIYINGVLEDTASQTNNTASISQTVRIGTDTGGAGRPEHDGDVDEPAIWNRVLSSTEWNAFYNGGDGVQFPFSVASTEATSNALFFGGGV